MMSHHPNPHSGRRNVAPTPTRLAPYSRADAIADALLFEVPIRLTRLFRFSYPVAVTAQAWFDAVAWDARAEAGKPRPTGQNETWRITELLLAAHHAAATSPAGSEVIPFTVHRVPPTGPVTRTVRLTLQISIHTGDHGETVATISHRPLRIAGRFHLADTPDTHWPAVDFDVDLDGRTHLLVTADTLDGLIAARAEVDCRGVYITPIADGTLLVANWDGTAVALQPDPDGLYHLELLGWPIVSEPDDT